MNLTEKYGVVSDLKPMFELLKKSILTSPYENFRLGKDFDFGKFPIHSIIIEKLESKKTGGTINFKEGVNEYGDKVFVINLMVKFNRDELYDLDNFLNHELHHFYDFYVRSNKESKTKGFIKIKNKLRLSQDNQIINKFKTSIYLSLDEEVNARIQECYSDLKNGFSLKNTKSFNECMILVNYDINELDLLNDNEKMELLQRINELSEEMNVNLKIKNFEHLKQIFGKRFKEKGKKLLKKLLKISATHNQIQDSFEHSLEVLGESLYNIFTEKDFKLLH
jgi:hypothetical protein